MVKKFWWALALATALAGCSSVSLDEGQVPVEDRKGAAVITEPPAREAAAAPDPRASTQSRVAPVSADNGSGAQTGPAGIARLIFFDYDSYAVKPEYQAVIEGHARFLRADPARKIAVEGHTDERGGREYNLALGQRRAEAVRRELGRLGVPDSQVEAVSFGKEKPAATGSDDAAWSKNRRAEIFYR